MQDTYDASEHDDGYEGGTDEPTRHRLASGLGWFSIGLGLAEVAAPGGLARTIGLRDDESTVSTLRAFGLREIASGIAILANPSRPARVWSRVGGDAIDLSYLGAAMTREGTDRPRLAAATAAVLGVTALDVLCARNLGDGDSANVANGTAAARSGHVKVEHVVTVNRPPIEVYQFWRDLENLPRFMSHLLSVEVTGPRESSWRARGPAGMTVGWRAEILEDREAEWIAWRSIEGAVENRGSVRFAPAPGGRGTEVRVQLQYRPPAGAAGRTLAWLFGEEPEQQIEEDLRRFKQLMEAGEVPLSDGPGMKRPAQPAADARAVRNPAEGRS
jgi:uncharacterized membrane protein